jgi:hypothetical protein
MSMGEDDQTVIYRATTIRNPELSEWSCHLFGGTEYGINWRPLKGKEPNWFWRWMQFLCFGNRLVKDEAERPRGEG